jgi:hypothetical protein
MELIRFIKLEFGPWKRQIATRSKVRGSLKWCSPGEYITKEASSRKEPIEYLTQVALEIDRAGKDTISMDT